MTGTCLVHLHLINVTILVTLREADLTL